MNNILKRRRKHCMICNKKRAEIIPLERLYVILQTRFDTQMRRRNKMEKLQ